MAFINLKTKEIKVKIVYYGPAQSGKTTNLFYIYSKFKNQIRSKLISIDTFGDRTVFFDFLPFNLGKMDGFDILVQLYTVPGQVKYKATRELVLRGADGIVFVADISELKRKDNILSLNDLHHLVKLNMPVLSSKILTHDLNNQLKKPYYLASALHGHRVSSTLKKITAITIANIRYN
jgi:signal recognition particle receptor subunit beta